MRRPQQWRAIYLVEYHVTGRVHRYDPQRHYRRSVRLKGYDYAGPGAYFVTICVRERECALGRVVDGAMELNDCRRMVATTWQRIPRFFPQVELDAWVVMPNHVHGIIVIVDGVRGRGDAFPSEGHDDESVSGEQELNETKTPFAENVAPTGTPRPAGPPSGSLGAIVSNFKSLTTRRFNRMRKTPGVPLWQRGFYEHIIRNERELDAVRQYIADNPLKWELDRYHPQG
jgi:putative transposase